MKKTRILACASFAALALCAGDGTPGRSAAPDARPPAVAGQFYPAEARKLKLAVEQFLESSAAIPMEKPVALVVPHAGYVYSGQISADAFRQAAGHPYDVVVLLGVNHTTPGFRGISLGDYGSFHTPLGPVAVDRELAAALLEGCADCNRDRAVHAREHSIEVQLPFVQTLFPNARIVPVILHPADAAMCTRFGETLAKALRNRRALIVISSDLSHYPAQANAVKADHGTLRAIASLDTRRMTSVLEVLDLPGLDTRACGEAALLAGMTAARALGATRATVAGYANSGDALVGDAARTVGYGAVVFSPGKAPGDLAVLNRPAPPPRATRLEDADKKALLAFAREAIRRYLTTQTVPLPRNLPARAEVPQGAFVTLRKSGQLRGCIGHIPGDRPLGRTVGAMALQAAFEDPRFGPVQFAELKDLEIEISVLTPVKPVASADAVVPGRDGVVLSKDGTSAVFLPQVATENHWDRAEMLDQLCVKAGLRQGCWRRDARFQVFQADVFGASRFR